MLFSLSDPVRDADYAFWGDRVDVRVDKTGVGTFAPDTPPADQTSLGANHPSSGAFARCDRSETGEIDTEGNGLDGHDETSEPLDTTWIRADTATPGSATVGCP